MDNEHLEQLEKAKTAITIIDKILPHLPDQGVFHFAYFAKDVLNWPAEEVSELVSVKPQLVHIALNHLQYIDEKTKGFYYELNKIGREAKKAGGHFAYQEYLEKKKRIEDKRLRRKDSLDEIELKIKQWTYRAKYWPFIFSGLAFIGTIISITISFKALRQKQVPQYLQEVQEKIQLLQERADRQDSLFRVNIHQKKGNE